MYLKKKLEKVALFNYTQYANVCTTGVVTLIVIVGVALHTSFFLVHTAEFRPL